jgi:hypothetical protein
LNSATLCLHADPKSSNDQDFTGGNGEGCSDVVSDDVDSNRVVMHFAGPHKSRLVSQAANISLVASQATGIVNVHNADMVMKYLHL